MFWMTIGGLAACLTSFAFLPQVIKILKTKSVKDISFLSLMQFSLGVTLWTLYGLHLRDVIIIAANTASLLIIITTLILYFKYK